MKLAQPVYIQESCMTTFGEHYEKSLLDLITEVINGLNADLGTIDALYVGNMLSVVTGQLQHLSSQISGLLGRDMPIYTFEAACASGGMALHHACKDVSHQTYQNVLVIGAEKMTEHSPGMINQSLMRATNLSEQMSGISFSGLYALIAAEYVRRYDLSPDVLSYAPLLMHQQSQSNSKAQFQQFVSLDTIRQSRMVSSPLRLFDCAPITDGAAAVVLSQKKSGVMITQSAVVSTAPSIADRPDMISFPSTVKARASLDLPHSWIEKLKVIEAHDCFSISLIIALEDLGLAERGSGWKMLKALAETTENNWILNPSGGLKACGHPVGATGVKQVCAAYKVLQATSNGLGLTHNLGGTGGTAVIHVLERCN